MWRSQGSDLKTLNNHTSSSRKARLGGGGCAGPLFALLGLAALAGRAQALQRMSLAYTWGTLTYVFDSDQQRQDLEANGSYIPGNAVPFDVDIDDRRRVFLGIPSILPGVPASVGTIEDSEQRNSPRVRPYPDWSWHDGSRGCDGMVSVFRVFADGCGRLWVIDSGVRPVTPSAQLCPPKLLVFNLTDDSLIVSHTFTLEERACRDSALVTVVVEQVGDACSDDAYAYVADSDAFGLFVYSLRSRSSWKVNSDLFLPDVNLRNFDVAGVHFTLMDGVLGLAVSPPSSSRDGGRFLYFHSLTSRQEGRVPTAVLHNASLFADGGNAAPEEFRFIGHRPCQAGAEAMSRKGVMFFSPVCQNTIRCWNQAANYNVGQLTVEHDDRILHFVTGMKVKPGNNSDEELWAIANNGQALFSGTYQANLTLSVNIVRGSVRRLLGRRNCH